MLKRISLCAAAFAVIALVTASAAAQSNNRLERQIRKEILTLPYYGVFDAIGYQLNGNDVTLTGYVVQPSTKRDAEEAVSDIEGIGRVTNNIEVLPLSPADDRIRFALLRRLSNGGSLYRYFLGANPAIRIIVRNGRVTLEGFVDRKADADLANILARGVPGTFAVTNNLRVLQSPR